jgi:hypothetical protein
MGVIAGIALAPTTALAASCAPPQGSPDSTIGSTSWTGAVSSAWEDARNWNNGAPSNECDASIPSGAAVVMSVGGGANSLQLDGTLTVEGSIDPNNGTPVDSSLGTTTGTTISSTGALELTAVGANSGAPYVGGTITNSGSISVLQSLPGTNPNRSIRANVINQANGAINIQTSRPATAATAAATGPTTAPSPPPPTPPPTSPTTAPGSP